MSQTLKAHPFSLSLHCPSTAKRPCCSPPSDPLVVTASPRVSISKRDSKDRLLELFLGLADSTSTLSLDLSVDHLLESRPCNSDENGMIEQAMKMGSVLLEASKRSARKRATMHNAVVWALPPGLTTKIRVDLFIFWGVRFGFRLFVRLEYTKLFDGLPGTLDMESTIVIKLEACSALIMLLKSLKTTDTACGLYMIVPLLLFCLVNWKVSCVGRRLMGYLGNKGFVSVSMYLHETSFCFLCSQLLPLASTLLTLMLALRNCIDKSVAKVV
ncbi:hypothetical protein RHMOL_Rhmol10G0161900 [Rhododendron molle]|uniref:Uncharacterized protein n=1 Tax=Rhododendron molle TaxID=49168 RepID=A0ACC0M2V0_RHOML|nr:hypothetical protein RHMOL_Rhmol10G0161900 [Rhododendron molle]